MINQLNALIDGEEISGWLAKGRTVMNLKDVSKTNIADNYRLPLMWKLLLGGNAEELCKFLDNNDMFTDETKRLQEKKQRGKNSEQLRQFSAGNTKVEVNEKRRRDINSNWCAWKYQHSAIKMAQKKMGTNVWIDRLQKSVLFVTARLLHRVLEACPINKCGLSLLTPDN